MRTDEQIEKIKKYESSPIQLLNVISKEKVKSLINFHNQNNKVASQYPIHNTQNYKVI